MDFSVFLWQEVQELNSQNPCTSLELSMQESYLHKIIFKIILSCDNRNFTLFVITNIQCDILLFKLHQTRLPTDFEPVKFFNIEFHHIAQNLISHQDRMQLYSFHIFEALLRESFLTHKNPSFTPIGSLEHQYVTAKQQLWRELMTERSQLSEPLAIRRNIAN